MKKHLLLFLTSIVSFAATGCLKDVDWVPVVVTFQIQDSAGKDLLDPSSVKFIGSEIALTYKGEQYTYSTPTKTYMPHFSGLEISRDEASGKYRASFGELDGGKDYDENFLISLPGGATRTIHYERHINEFTISANQKWFLDGKRVELPVTIIIPQK